jgi:geranylgeranyl diphosphate synthase type II
MTDFKSQLKSFKEIVDTKLEQAASLLDNTNLKEPYLYFVDNGGKRIRPILTLLAAEINNADKESALSNAVAIELLHNFTLIHDDIMDSSTLRRGRPTIHKKWDEATAVLLGDMIIGMAYKYLDGNLNVHKAFSKALYDVCFGQAMDIKFNSITSVDDQDYFKMINNKTSSLLIASTSIGAYLGEDLNTASILNSYAEYLGLAFQLKDDLLDLTAQEAELGKTIGQDIVEGKKTFMILKTKERVDADGTKDEKELLNRFYSDNGLPIQFVPTMRQIMDKYEVLLDTEKVIMEYSNKSLQELEKINLSDSKRMLVWLTEYLLIRNH